jgi:hypothetical protein
MVPGPKTTETLKIYVGASRKPLIRSLRNVTRASLSTGTLYLRENEEQRSQDEWLIPQSVRILDLMFNAIDTSQHHHPMSDDWNVYKMDMHGKWSARIQHMMLVLAAMASCRIPLSAVKWALENFIPVCVKFSELRVLGLLAKHARKEQIGGCQTMFCVGRHTSRSSRGQDLTLVDPISMMPVGIVPDFAFPEQKNEEFVERMSTLYGDFVVHTNNGDYSAFMHVPLHAIRVRQVL